MTETSEQTTAEAPHAPQSLEDQGRELNKLRLISRHVAELSPAGKAWLRDHLNAELGQ